METLLKQLCQIPGVSGDERNISEFIKEKLSKFCKVSIENDNSVIASLGKEDANNHILFDAHIDQIGFIITAIEENGFIKFAPCGGIDPRILPGSIVKVCGNETIPGVICSVPPHIKKEKPIPLDIDQMFIDVGMSKEEIVKIVNIGNRIYFNNGFYKLANNNFASPATDDRAGVCILIKLAEKLANENFDTKFTFLFSSREEIGSLGAKISSYKIKPSQAIALDVSFAKQPFVNSDKYQRLSCGAMVCIAPSLSRDISNTLTKICIDKKIPYQIEVYPGKSSTNADTITLCEYGIPCGVVSIPQRYMHTGIEVVNIDDMEQTLALLLNYANQGGIQ